ncbi:hypothetical protein AVEN_89928-1 [Araneus ventricosus]|uniref:Uncharacterized protein n=1 Tax=Araneus ventricosus TaxID=182803 RepID=A0A4Y2NUP6_ARAVE|nr:hypothetical protein AVEN_89928-1 [Araneus ventricosus]
MDLSVPFHLFSWVLGDANGRPFISYLYPKGSLNDHSPNCLLPHSEQQPAEIRPISIEVVWPVTAGLGVRGLKEYPKKKKMMMSLFVKSASWYYEKDQKFNR